MEGVFEAICDPVQGCVQVCVTGVVGMWRALHRGQWLAAGWAPLSLAAAASLVFSRQERFPARAQTGRIDPL